MDSANFPRLSLTPIARALRQRGAWLGAAGLAVPSLAMAGPSGGQVVGGHAEISTPNGNTTTIDQSTHSAVINWQTFSIGGEEYVVFNQPSSSSVALNRVLGGAPSEIFGHLLANGRVFLVNPSGVLFAPGAELDVGGLVATTMNISDTDFMAGRYVFTEGGDGEVVNAGSIHSADGGFVVLAGDHVGNTGLIQARLGEVVLASGSAMTLDLNGDGLVGFSVDAATVSELAGVDNLGRITADGGSVLMTAAVARGLLGTVVNNEGLVRAQSIEAGADGSIMLSASGGGISQSGTLDASAAGNGNGGNIQLLADGDIELAAGSRTLARGGDAGHGGEIRSIAEGDLYSAGTARVDVRGGASGGLVELSGHRGITIRGSQQIGPGGRLLIDPSEISIGASGGQGCEFDYCYELLEDVLVQGADVDLVAQDLISFYATADGHFDGRNGQGSGGNLLIGIGSVDGIYYRGAAGDIQVADGSLNAFLMDGGISIYAGESSGSISGFGELSGAGIELAAGGNIEVGALSSSSGSVDIYAGGNIIAGDIAARSGNSDDSGVSSAYVSVNAGGALDTGNVEAAALNGPNGNVAGVSLYAGNSITAGDISAQGEPSAEVLPFGLVDLNSRNGGIDVGAVDSAGSVGVVSAEAFTASSITAYDDVAIEAEGISIAGAVMAAVAPNLDTLGEYDYGDGIYLNAQGGDLSVGNLSLGEFSSDPYVSIDLLASGSILGGDIYSPTHSVSIYAENGSVQFGTLDADGASILAGTDLSAGNIRIIGSGGEIGLSLQAVNGDVKVGDIASGTGVTLYAQNGGIESGDIAATTNSEQPYAYAYVSLYALNDITAGSISATSSATEYGSADIGMYSQTGSVLAGALSSLGGPNDYTGIYLNAATTATIGDITTDGTTTVYAGSGIVTGDVAAQDSIYMDTLAGDLTTGDLSVRDNDTIQYYGRTELSLYASDGAITTGDITVDGSGPAYLGAFAGGSLSTGAISVHAGPNGGGGYNPDAAFSAAVTESASDYDGYYADGAQVYLAAVDAVTVNGNLTLSAEAVSNEFIGDGYSYNSLEGGATAQIEGSAVTIAGTTSIAGFGDSGLYIDSTGDVTTGDIAIDSAAAEYSESGGGYSDEEHYGLAYLQVFGGDTSRVGLGEVSLVGPEAGVLISGGRVDIEGDFHASARAAGSEGSAWQREIEDGEILVDSTFSGVGVRLTALSDGISVTGDLMLDGPTAGITLASTDDISIGGDLSVLASGYAVDGDATRLLDEDGLAGSPVSPLLLPPVLFEGRTEWGGAGVLIAGTTLENGVLEDSDFAGAVSVGGNLQVSGQGIALTQVQADGLRVGGTTSTDATLGRLSGSWRETRTIDGADYEVTRSVSGTDGESPARHAISGIYLGLRDGDGMLGDVSASGGNAYIQFDGGQHWSVGDITVAGGLGELANDYADIASFAALVEGAPSIGDTQTLLIGGLNSFAVGDEAGGPPLSFASGDISVSGAGQAALVVVSGSASTGALSVTAQNGLVETNDPTVLAEPVSLIIGDASLQIVTDGPLAAGAVSIDALGNVHLGGNFTSSGDVSISSAGLIDGSIPIEYLPSSPLGAGANIQVSGGSAAPARSNISLLPLNIAADGAVTMQFSDDSALDGLELSGSTVDLNGHGASLSVSGDATVAAESRLDLGNTTLAASSISLSGELDLSQASLSTSRLSLHEVFGDLSYGDFEGELLSLMSDNGNVTAGNIAVDALTVAAAGGVSLGDLLIAESLALTAGDAAGTLIAIGDIDYDGPLSFEYSNTSMSLGDVNTQSLILALTEGNASFGSVDADSVDISAASISSLGSSINAEQIAMSAGGAIALDGSQLTAGSIDLSGDSLSLGDTTLASTDLALRQFSGDLAFGNFEGSALSLTADGGSISAGNIDADSLEVSSANNLTLGNLTINEALSLAAGDTVGTQILIGDIAYGGALDFSYANADLTLGDVSAQALSIELGNGDAHFDNVDADSVEVFAAGISSLGSGINAEQITMTSGGVLALDGSQLTADRIDLSGDSIGLGDTTLATADLVLRQFSGDLVFGNFEGSALSLTADAGSISAGNIDVSALAADAAGNLTLGDLDVSESLTLTAGDAAGTQILIGDISYGGVLGFNYANADVTLGDVSAQALNIELANGNARFGSVDADSLDVSAVNIVSQDSSLNAETIGLLAANQLTLDSVNVNASNAVLRAGNMLSLSDSSITADQLELRSDEADVSLAGSSLSADSVAIRAGGDVLASGEGTTIDAGGLGVIAGDRIELAEAQLTVGTGDSPFAGDDTLIARLPAALRPTSLNPNAAFTAGGGIRLGGLSMAGDHLYLHTNSVRFSGNITAPTDLFVQFRPYDDALSLGIENLASTTQDINFTVDQHVTVFPGTTLAFGGSTYAGNIVVGDSAALDLAGHDSNFIFLTSGTISGATQKIPTNGQVVVLGGTVLDVPEQEPDADPGINGAVPPDPEGDSLPGEGGVLVSVASADDEDDLIDETAGGEDAECE
ncbi:MAG: filamentous hemagglutinin N-terminal domain-containing protein [Pseudomonadota bacterium]|nr:filamentous hemagglutinin N-terminal domain-containing protein [Pseudomonadota bacterium]